MNRLGLYSTLVVVSHAVVAAVHGMAHFRLGVGLTRTQFLFVLIVIGLAPVLAMVLLWARLRRAGAWLLLLCMAGGLVFGAYYHFIAAGPDNVAQVAAGAWHAPFQGTAIFLAVSEGLGCGVGACGLRAVARAS